MEFNLLLNTILFSSDHFIACFANITVGILRNYSSSPNIGGLLMSSCTHDTLMTSYFFGMGHVIKSFIHHLWGFMFTSTMSDTSNEYLDLILAVNQHKIGKNTFFKNMDCHSLLNYEHTIENQHHQCSRFKS